MTSASAPLRMRPEIGIGDNGYFRSDMARLGIVHHRLYQDHDPGPYHPESPKRLAALEDILSGPARGLFEEVEPVPAREADILRVHTPDHLKRVAATAGRSHTMLDPDTQTSPLSFEAAMLAAGGVIELVRSALAGEIQAGLALVRPPGHHAEAERSMGFCLFNNVAVAAAYALAEQGLDRVLIVDWDLHHGNGTQHTFEEDNRVLYFSTHQYPYYPGTGAAREVGQGKGRGLTVNVPLSSGHGDEEYVQIFERILKPLAREYKPGLILISAGFDTHFNDPLGSQKVTPKGYAAMTRALQELAAGKVPLVFALEGGYNIQGEADSILALMEQLAGRPVLRSGELRDDPKRKDIPAVTEVRQAQADYWPNLSP